MLLPNWTFRVIVSPLPPHVTVASPATVMVAPEGTKIISLTPEAISNLALTRSGSPAVAPWGRTMASGSWGPGPAPVSPAARAARGGTVAVVPPASTTGPGNVTHVPWASTLRSMPASAVPPASGGNPTRADCSSRTTGPSGSRIRVQRGSRMLAGPPKAAGWPAGRRTLTGSSVARAPRGSEKADTGVCRNHRRIPHPSTRHRAVPPAGNAVTSVPAGSVTAVSAAR